MDEEADNDDSSIKSEEDNDFVIELSESLNLSSAKSTKKGDAFDLDLSFPRINTVIQVALSHSNQHASPSGPLTLQAATRKTTTIPTI
jgi:hypothetical protein